MTSPSNTAWAREAVIEMIARGLWHGAVEETGSFSEGELIAISDDDWRQFIPMAEEAYLAVERKAKEECARLLRCRVTNNPVGTDTWAKWQPCGCNSCQVYLSTLPPTSKAE